MAFGSASQTHATLLPPAQYLTNRSNGFGTTLDFRSTPPRTFRRYRLSSIFASMLGCLAKRGSSIGMSPWLPHPRRSLAQAGRPLTSQELSRIFVDWLRHLQRQTLSTPFANGAVEVIKAIVHDTKLIAPVSTLLNDVYGVSILFFTSCSYRRQWCRRSCARALRLWLRAWRRSCERQGQHQ